MTSPIRNPAVAAATELPPRRYPEVSAVGLQRRAVVKLIREYDLGPGDVDAILTAPAGMGTPGPAHFFTQEVIADMLGIQPRSAATMVVGGATHGVMLKYASVLIGQGEFDSVLCVAAGKYGKPSEQGEEQAKMTVDEEFEYPYGASFLPALYALPTRRHMFEHGSTPEDFARVSVAQRRWALRTESAYMKSKGPLTVDDVMDSPPVVEPYHRLHCSVPTEGGGAHLLTTGDRAQNLADQPAYVLGWGEAHTHGAVTNAPDPMNQGHTQSANRAFERSGLGPDDIDVAQLYDAFAAVPVLALEAMGFVEPGEGATFYHEGRADPGGDLPVNTSGGLLSYGHTGDSSGMSVMNEAIQQTMGTAGDHQVPDVRYSLGHVSGGVLSEHSTVIFGREPA